VESPDAAPTVMGLLRLSLRIGGDSEGQHGKCNVNFKACLVLGVFIPFSLMVGLLW